MKKVCMLLAALSLLCGCGKGKTEGKSDKAESDSVMSVNHAKGFTVEYMPGYKRVTVHSPWERGSELAVYYLVRDAESETPGDGKRIRIPLQSLAVASCTHFEFLDMMGELGTVRGICTPNLVYNSSIRQMYAEGKVANLGDSYNINTESLLMLAPDAIMMASHNQQDESVARINNSGTTVIFNNEWTENTLLARAEWIKYVAAFYDKEHEADSLFAEMERNYCEARRLAAVTAEKPSVMAGGNYKGTWYMPGGESYMCKLFEDAGCSYFYADDETTTSIPLNFETVLYNFADADMWLNAPAGSMEELMQMDERHNLFEAAKRGNVYGFYARTLDGGANDFWESAVAHPDIVLKDVIWAAHPEVMEGYEPVYIVKLK